MPFVRFTREDTEFYALYCEHQFLKHSVFDHENPLWPEGQKPADPLDIIKLWEDYRETAFKSGDPGLKDEMRYLKTVTQNESDSLSDG